MKHLKPGPCPGPASGSAEGSGRLREPLPPDRAAVRDLVSVFRCGYRNGLFESGSGLFFDSALRRLKDMKYTPDDLLELSFALAEFEKEADFGFRFQRVMNTAVTVGPEDSYVIRTSHLDSRVDCLGNIRGKTLMIEGDAGDCAGIHMEDSKLVIDGNAGKALGAKMRSGEIHIEGDFESLAFSYGGKIFRRGDLIWSSE